MRWDAVLLALGVSCVITLDAHSADVLPSVEEYFLRSEFVHKCQADESDEDKAYFEKGSAAGAADFVGIWTQLSASDPSNYEENARRAEEIFRDRLIKAVEAAEMKVKTLGCAELQRQMTPSSVSGPKQ